MSERAQHADTMERDLEIIKLELDKDGSPVAIEPRGWFVCIVPGLVRWDARLPWQESLRNRDQGAGR